MVVNQVLSGLPGRMSKYISKAARKRLPLSPKHARKGFYKGMNSASTGWITSKGRFQVDDRKRIELNVPDLTGFKLKPYVSPTVFLYPAQAGIAWPPPRRSKSSNFLKGLGF